MINGKLNLLVKSNNKKYENFISLVNNGDDGDTYDYSPLKGDKEIIFNYEKANVETRKHNNLSEMKISLDTKIPQDLNSRISHKEIIVQPIEMVITIEDGNIKLNINIDNKAMDHR
jgi:mannosylglycerate hydrolase